MSMTTTEGATGETPTPANSGQSQVQSQAQAKRPPLGHIATLYSGKGGSGKTTSTFHLAAALVAKGYSVLMVDWDGGQASLSAMANVDVTGLEYGLYEAIRTMLDNETLWLSGGSGSNPAQQQDLRALLGKTSQVVKEEDRRFAIIGNNLELAALESELSDMTGREYVLQKFLARYSPRFDFTLIDPPANRGLLAVNALTASHSLLLPVEASSIGFQATCSMLSHNKFLPRITGRSWTEEMGRSGVSA
jgi:chromosome partitioning protein